MKKVSLLLLLAIISLSACKKEASAPPPSPVTPPAMNYINLSDRQVKFGQSFSTDLDGDGKKDIIFYTQLVGDPILRRDYRQYILTSSISTFFPFNPQEQIPVLDKEAPISLNGFEGFEWYNASEVVLANKVIGEDGPPWWEGSWKTAAHKYVPVQLNKNGQQYYAWVDLSFDIQSETLIVHKAGVSKEPRKAIKAGL